MMKEKNGDEEEVVRNINVDSIKTISPPRPHQDHVSQIEIHHPRLLINPDCDQ